MTTGLHRIAAGFALLISLALTAAAPPARAAGVDPRLVTTGILYDRVVPLSRIAEFDGRESSPPATKSHWRQMYFEMRRASLAEPAWPVLELFMDSARQRSRDGVIPLALMDLRYQATSPTDGSLAEKRVFAATALIDYTYRGGVVRFVLDRERVVTNAGAAPSSVELDFGDGLGWREVRFGIPITVHYDTTGPRVLRLRATGSGGSHLFASFPFEIRSLMTPAPNDTLAVAASVPYQGQYGTGEAYVYLAAAHAALTNPIVVIEGFDIDNSMDWDELYAQLNQQNLLETMRSEGFDAVVLNFTESTNPIQENGFVVENLLEQVVAAVPPSQPLVLVGASMGGLASRYALDWMETNAVPHHVRTFISFDAPQKGANIPLGVQYWVDFFSDLSADAAFLLNRLDTPAARQMLVYHHTTPASPTGTSDPLRGVLDQDFAALGDYPALPRLVAIANGSGTQTGQGFSPGEQVIRYHYSSPLLAITGDVWAVPSPGPTVRIFNGRVAFILLPPSTGHVDVSGTAPYDNAPGGSRPTMAQMDSASTGYGDIVALYQSHCFIPTVSALALDTSDLFYDIAGDPDLLAHTPFDAVYFPSENQPHVTVTAESAPWILNEIRAAVSAVATGPGDGLSGIAMPSNHPNPFRDETAIRFDLPVAEKVSLEVYDATGRRLATLANGLQGAGPHEFVFRRGDLSSGVYFCRLRAGALERTIKMTRTR